MSLLLCARAARVLVADVSGYYKTTCISVRKMAASTAAADIKIKESRVSKHMKLRIVQGDPSTRCHERTLVIMFPFINAKNSILSRYCNLYHQRGHNVLLVQGNMQHFLWPQNGVKVAQELLDYLTSNKLPLDISAYHVHAFSIGAYIYTLVMMELAKGNAKYEKILPRIQSQIFDSLTIGGFDYMIQGMVARTKNALMKTAISLSFTSYLRLTKPYTEDFMVGAVDHFKTKPIRTPILLYYSLNDPMSKAEEVQSMIHKWQNKYGLDVFVKCWEVSLHAGHLKAHPEEYKKALQAFLNHVESLQTKPKSML